MNSYRSFIRIFALAALISLLAAGCGHEAASSADGGVTPQAAPEIEWFDGTVDEAFALAKEERRPVFLYWGAVWCPPCHALRTKLFTQPEFIARLSATVPVYLDGDTERAQIWGEKLGTAGYPTVIVLDPDGNEITRILGTLPMEEYGEVVSLAIDASRPIAEILAAVETDGAADIPQSELNILGFYSYGQDKALNLDVARQRTLFGGLRKDTPDEYSVEKARFLTLELWALADDDNDTPVAELSSDQRAELIGEVKTLFADRTLRNTNLDLVLYGAGSIAPLLAPEAGEMREDLTAAWIEAAVAVEADESLSTDDRLTAIYPRIRLITAFSEEEDPEIPAELQDHVREQIKWASDVVKDEDEMQAVMSSMAAMLEIADLEEEANTLLSEKMSETTAPYYYMGWLAGNEASAGNEEKAVDLYRQAWQSVRGSGPASSMSAFRWGSSYARRAMQYTPDATEVIAADSTMMVGDLLSGPDAFSGGNWSRLKSLGSAMDKWQAEDVSTRGPVLESLKKQVNDACENFEGDDPESAGGRCNSFMADTAV